METLKIRCPRCKNEFRVDESSSGQVMGCPNCQQKIRIPKIEKKPSICFDISINRISDDHRIEVIAAIRELKGIGQMEAVDFAEHLPQTLLKNIPSERAEQLKRRLEEAGAVVHMEPSDTQGVREENDSARKTDDEKTAKEIPENARYILIKYGIAESELDKVEPVLAKLTDVSGCSETLMIFQSDESLIFRKSRKAGPYSVFKNAIAERNIRTIKECLDRNEQIMELDTITFSMALAGYTDTV